MAHQTKISFGRGSRSEGSSDFGDGRTPRELCRQIDAQLGQVRVQLMTGPGEGPLGSVVVGFGQQLLEGRRVFVVGALDFGLPPSAMVELLLDEFARATRWVTVAGNEQLAVQLQQPFQAVHEGRHVATVFPRNDDRARVGDHIPRQQGLRGFFHEAKVSRIVARRVDTPQAPLRIPTAHEHFAVVERAVDLERDLRSHGWMRRIGTAYRWRSASAEHVWSGCE